MSESIYKQMNKIDDNESLSEKWNVKNQEELKKLIKESIKGSNEALTRTKPSPQLLSVVSLLGITLNQLVKKEQDEEFSNADTYTLVGTSNTVQAQENKLRNINAELLNERGSTESYIRDYEIPENDTYVCVKVNKKGKSYLILVDRRTMIEKVN